MPKSRRAFLTLTLTLTLTLLLITLVVSGCGFKLRGQINIPEHLKVLHLTGKDNYGDFITEAARVFKKSGIELTASASEAPYTIDILRDYTKKRAIAVGSNLRNSEYELRQEIEFEVRGRDGVRLLMPSVISTTRNYNFDENQLRAKEREEQQLKKEMRRDLIKQLLRRIQALKETNNNATTQ